MVTNVLSMKVYPIEEACQHEQKAVDFQNTLEPTF